ncbi:hexitol phosphatase HxpB [Candidatus Saccharibacteria bacterium]|nr:hexitol phosphatase HxpB [Candidatus Saccharibacteria bacterium]
MIQAVIFDMDGLLIDSEPIWKESEVKIFTQYGVPLTYAMTKQTMGLRTEDVVNYWYHRYPWAATPKNVVVRQIDQLVLDIIQEKAKPMMGVIDVLNSCKQAGLQMAVASSSSLEIIHTVLEKLKIPTYIDVIHSAQNEEHGKPHPAVFMTAADQMGVPIHSCVVFEDSITGVIAAKAAGMVCIAVPQHSDKEDGRYAIADIVIPSLKQFRLDMIMAN